MNPKWEQLANMLVRKLQRDNVGSENTIHADELLKYLDLTNDRDLRTVVMIARKEMRVPIVSTSDDGYCIARGYDDDCYQHCIAQRKDVARSNWEVVEDINKAMEATYGQPSLFEVS